MYDLDYIKKNLLGQKIVVLEKHKNYYVRETIYIDSVIKNEIQVYYINSNINSRGNIKQYWRKKKLNLKQMNKILDKSLAHYNIYKRF